MNNDFILDTFDENKYARVCQSRKRDKSITVSMYLLVDRIKIPQIEKKKVLNYISVFKSLEKNKNFIL
jgi:hypothetical protein